MQLYIASHDLTCAGPCSLTAREEGWCVKLVETGSCLLASLRNSTGSSLLLVDLDLPDMDGFKLTEALADIHRPMRLRFFSNGMDNDVIATRMKASALDLPVGMSLFKPVDQAWFRRMLTEEARLLA